MTGSSPQKFGFIIQGRPKTHDALIAPEQPDKNFGNVDRDNRLTRGERTNAMLIRFDLSSQTLLRDAKVSKATLHFWVWDPSARGRTRVTIYALKTPWDEASASWKHPATGKNWLGGADGFAIGRDRGPEVAYVVVEPRMALIRPTLPSNISLTRRRSYVIGLLIPGRTSEQLSGR